MNAEHKTLQLAVEYKVTLKKREVESYASIFGNRDLGGDVVHAGAFSKSLEKRGLGVPLLWQHDETIPLARPRLLEQDSKGLHAIDVFSKTRAADEALELINDKVIKGMSFAWLPFKDGLETSDEGRELKSIDVLERSIVTFPMNELASIEAVRKSWLGAAGEDHFKQLRAEVAELKGLLLETASFDPDELAKKGRRLRSLLRDLVDARSWNSDSMSWSDITREMARVSGMSEAGVSEHLWGGVDSPSDEVLAAWAPILGVDPSRLIGARAADTTGTVPEVDLDVPDDEASNDLVLEANGLRSSVLEFKRHLKAHLSAPDAVDEKPSIKATGSDEQEPEAATEPEAKGDPKKSLHDTMTDFRKSLRQGAA